FFLSVNARLVVYNLSLHDALPISELIKSSFFDSGIIVREASVQTCPELKLTFETALFAAPSISASSKMIIGDLPPSSRAVFLIVLNAFFVIFLPVAPEPVNETKSISGCQLIPFPTTSPVPFTKLNTPFGTPAASNTSANIIAANGVNSDGFKTTVLPAANALAIFVDV